MNKSFLAVLALIVAGMIGLFFAGGGPADLTDAEAIVYDNPTAIQTEDFVKGNPSALVTLTEYGDFQCPFCATAFPHIQALEKEFGDRVAFVFRNFPLSNIHGRAVDAAKAAVAAGEQDKFFEMHDLLYENQEEWSQGSNAKGKFERYAEEIGINVDKYKEDFSSDLTIDKVQYGLDIGNQIGVPSTPTFYLNDQLVTDNTIQGDAGYQQMRERLLTLLGEDPNTPAPGTAVETIPEVVPEENTEPAS